MPQRYDALPFQVDHVIARKHGGGDEPENLALSCFNCNSFKGPNVAGVDPETGQVAPLSHPRRDVWDEHFRWDGPRLAGLTPQGRATVAVLAINLAERVEHRRLLIESGELPS